MGKRVMWFDKE